MGSNKSPEEQWREVLTGEVRGLQRMRSVMLRIPSEPRCKLCAAPFGRPGQSFLRFVGFGQSPINRRLCKGCIRSIHKKPGGADVDVSVLFADVRGSTALAERISPHDFSSLMARFYGTAAQVVDRSEGIIDKFVGDEVMALFIPGFSGQAHAAPPSQPRASCSTQLATTEVMPGSRSVQGCTRASPTWDPSAKATPGTSPRSAIL